MGFGIWLEFISVGSSQFIARYLIRLDTQHLPGNIHEILCKASHWPNVFLLRFLLVMFCMWRVQMCSKVAARFSSGYCSVNQISSTLDIFIRYFFHFPNVLGPLSYPREGSREAINCVRVTNSQVFYQ